MISRKDGDEDENKPKNEDGDEDENGSEWRQKEFHLTTRTSRSLYVAKSRLFT